MRKIIGGTEEKETMRKTKPQHTVVHTVYFELMHAITPFTNMNTSAHVKPVAFPGFNLSYSATEVDSFLCLWG